MDIFGIGPLEFILILLVILLVFGPSDLAKAGRSLGRTLRKLVMSDEWQIITQSAREFRHLPNRLIREAGIEEIKKDLPDIRRDADIDGLTRELKDWQQDVSAWTKPPEEPTKTARPVGEAAKMTAKPSVATTPHPSAKPAQTTKTDNFSWDDPDILPIEDDNP